ncbi:transglutaminase-like domain-containing protein [Patulibacter sp. SYSU D01012]|uniref:transglutaminase-like domain-containing protein n=1 Tax=Patulibacter sp. SYSU D01012 TaxID=2817381 RepID=UPI001B315975|nr:transglutaminase-like domain-containing protein [Patulibacter sp. SYSU D01012]
MTGEDVRAAPAVGRGLAVLLLTFAGAAAWWPVLGAGALWATPMVALAALVVARVLPARAGLLAAVPWIPASLLLGGLPAAALRPGAWGDTASALARAVDGLTVPARGPVGPDPWPLAGALLLAGVGAVVAAALCRRRTRAWRLVGLLLLALPVVGALALEQTGDAGWPGAAVVAAALLWLSRGRLRTAVPATVAVALVAGLGAQALGPDERWIPFVGAAARKPGFTRLDPSQTYGPLPDRRTGRTMLDVEADAPALWRMQALEEFDGRVWSVARDDVPDLPEPAAETRRATVHVRGLQNRLVVAPGAVTDVQAAGEVRPMWGDAWGVQPGPRPGDTYTVEARAVRATAAGLQDVPVPAAGRYPDYTSVWPQWQWRRSQWPGPGPGRTDGQARGRRPDELTPAQRRWLRSTPWGRAGALAERLARGTRSQLEVVRRVQSYLQDGDRFRYTTDVPQPGPFPLADFLFETHRGYCQQFAGAAAMLLRLADVPTRVVTGFATGRRTGDGRYDVRDSDAHAWIEVYFPGFGWVPFDPTPPGDAEVDASLDLLTPAGAGAGAGGGATAAVGGALVLLLVGGGLVARRRRGREAAAPAGTGELLVRLVPGPVAPSTTLAGLRPRLARLGPAVAGLADEAQRQRFADDGTPSDPHPRLRVWRALRRDVGPARATVLLGRAVLTRDPAERR